MQQSDMAMVALAAVTAVGIGAGLYATGGPEYARKIQRDEIRIDHLQQLMSTVDCTARSGGGKLPETLDPANDCAPLPPLTDPGSDEPYRYLRTGTGTYQLCAGFETDMSWRNGFDLADFDPATGCLSHTIRLYE